MTPTEYRVREVARDAARASAARQTSESISATDVATDIVDALYLRGCFDRSFLTAVGDTMQSAASRVSSAVRRVGADRALSYEDSAALCELDSAVDEWTEARR